MTADRGTTGGARALLCALVAVCLALGGTGCAAPGSDLHLEPLFARFTAADGATETEALFGLYHQRIGGARKRHTETAAPKTTTTLGPLWGFDREPYDGSNWRSRFLVPFGFASRRDAELEVQLPPLFIWQRFPRADGSVGAQLLTGWGWIFRSNSERGDRFGWFPFYGDFEDFFVLDHLRFVLWPLWTDVSGQGSRGWHFLFPFLAWTRGEGKNGWRVWPLFGNVHKEGSYRRWFAFWPLFHRHENRLSTPTPERMWMLWPLFGRTTAGRYAATTILWPIFGWAKNPENGFWALDLPWPFVRIQRGPDDISRTRFWPFFSHLKAGSLDAWSFLWPFVHIREETYPTKERSSLVVIPFWQSWRAHDKATDERSSWTKAFPLFQYETRGDWRRGSFPTLDPWQRNTRVDRHFAWLWKLWEWEAEEDRRHGRAWAGLVRRETNRIESKTSVSFLYAGRRRRTDAGIVREHSILFGLLRWRVTEEGGFDMLRPAFPGPGWTSESRPESRNEGPVGNDRPPVSPAPSPTAAGDES